MQVGINSDVQSVLPRRSAPACLIASNAGDHYQHSVGVTGFEKGWRGEGENRRRKFKGRCDGL